MTTINKVSFGYDELATDSATNLFAKPIAKPQGRRSQIRSNKSKLVGMLTNINDTLGITGPVKISRSTSDEKLAEKSEKSKQTIDMGNGNTDLENVFVAKCSKRQKFMKSKHDFLTEAI